MPYEFYKVLHILGLVLTFSSLIGFALLLIRGATLEGSARKLIFISHGIGLLLLLVSGFGLLARLNIISDWPTWIYYKLGIWIIAGALISVFKKKPQWTWYLYFFCLFLVTTAAYFAVNKPI